MNRKLFSLGVVMALLFTLTIPVGAVTDSPADSDTASVENNYDGPGAPANAPNSEEGTAEQAETAAITPNVKFPDGMRIIFNPYRMSAVWNGATVDDLVLSETVFIVNQESFPVRVNLSVSGTPKTDECEVVPVSSPEELGGDTKQAFVWFEFQPFVEGVEPVWDEAFTDAGNQVAVNAEDGKEVILPAAESIIMKAFGEFHIPRGTMWKSSDTIHFQVNGVMHALDVPDNAELFGEVLEAVENAEDVTDIAEPVEDEELFDVAEPVEYNEEPVEDAALSNAVEPVEDEEAFIVAEPVEYAEPFDNEEPVEDAALSNAVEPVEDEEAFIVAQPVEYAEPSDNEEPVEDAALSDVVEPVEDKEAFIVAEPVEYNEEPVEDAALSNAVEPVEDEEAFIVAQPVEYAEPSDNEEPVEDAALSDAVEPVEDAESFDVAEPVEDEEPSNVAEPVETNMEISYDVTPSLDARPAKEVE